MELLIVVSFHRTADFIPPQKVFHLRGTAEPIAFSKDTQNGAVTLTSRKKEWAGGAMLTIRWTDFGWFR